MAANHAKYEDVIEEARKLISEAVLAREPDLARRARDVDALLLGVLREVGLASSEEILNTTARAEAARVAEAENLVAQHRKSTPFLPSSGGSKSSRRTSGTRRRK